MNRCLPDLIVAALLFGASSSAPCFADDCAKQTSHLVDLSSYVARAKVLMVGAAPGFFSGVTPAIQDVQYEIEQNYKGKLPEQRATVEHRVYSGSRMSQKKPIGLNRKIFQPGNEVILFLQSPTLDIKNECAVQIANPALETQLHDVLHTQ